MPTPSSVRLRRYECRAYGWPSNELIGATGELVEGEVISGGADKTYTFSTGPSRLAWTNPPGLLKARADFPRRCEVLGQELAAADEATP